MNTATPSQLSPAELPARRVDAAGSAHVDLRAVLALALPLLASSAVQTILNLTDLWFIGHISHDGTGGGRCRELAGHCGGPAAGRYRHGGADHGGGRPTAPGAIPARRRLPGRACGASCWWRRCSSASRFRAITSWHPFGIAQDIEDTASRFWLPRVAGAPLGVAVWGCWASSTVSVGRAPPWSSPSSSPALNILLNRLFIFDLGLGGSQDRHGRRPVRRPWGSRAPWPYSCQPVTGAGTART